MILSHRLVVVLFLLLSGNSVQASDIQIQRRMKLDPLSQPRFQMVLSKEKENGSCQTLKKIVDPFLQWKNFSDEVVVESPKIVGDAHRCKVDIFSTLPKQVQVMETMRLKYSGPDCFNSALYMSGFVDKIRVGTASEMTLWLSSRYCKKLEVEEAPELGDIHMIRGAVSEDSLKKNPFAKNHREIHAMFYVGNGIVFSKPGNLRGFSHQVVAQSSDIMLYDRDKNKQECFEGRTEGCTVWMDRFRCDSVQAMEDLSKVRQEQPLLNDMITKTDQIALETEKLLIQGGNYHEIKDRLYPIVLDLQEAASSERENYSELDLFHLQALERRLYSLRKQYENFAPRKRHY